MSKTTYTEANIEALEGLEPVRRRPGMYIGSVDMIGVRHCAYEVITNVIDEFMQGYGSSCWVTVNSETGVVTVVDQARGIPSGPHPDARFKGKSTLEVVLTHLHAGAKLGGGGNSYKSSGGLHGVGTKVVNAVSSWLQADVYRDGNEYHLSFERGKVTGPIQASPLPKKEKGTTGTAISYKLDPEIFTETDDLVPEKEWLVDTCQTLAYLNPGLTFNIDYDGEAVTVVEEGGLAALAMSRAKADPKGALSRKPCMFEGVAEFKLAAKEGAKDRGEEQYEIPVQVALAWSAGYSDTLLSYTNSVRQPEGGSHVTGLKLTLQQVFQRFIVDRSLLGAKDKELKITSEDVLEGCHAVVSIRHPDPVYKGQTKGVLANSDAQAAVQRVLSATLRDWLEENPSDAKTIALKVIGAAKARVAQAKARDQQRKENTGSSGLNTSKFADCSSNNVEEREIFYVEGDSAGGPAKMGRNKRTQAVFPLKGKILNVLRSSLDRAYNNAEISDMLSVGGLGYVDPASLPEYVYPTEGEDEGAYEARFDEREAAIEAIVSKRKYEKYIVMADADIDGGHISCLLLTFFFAYQRPLIERGHVYIALPPLYKLQEGSRKPSYIKDDAALAEYYMERANGILSIEGAEEDVGGYEPARLFEAYAAKIREGFEKAGSKHGYAPHDLALSLVAAASGADDLAALATGLSALREVGGWERCEATELPEGGFVCSGLNPEGRYKTTVVGEGFLAAMEDAVERIDAALGEGYSMALMGSIAAATSYTLEFRGKTTRAGANPYEICMDVEAAVRKGITISRLKGLGEMNDGELRATTMSPASRRMLRVLVSDFNEAGVFVDQIMGSDDPVARRELIARASSDLDVLDV